MFRIRGIGLYRRGFVSYGHKLFCIDTYTDHTHTVTQVDGSVVPITRNRVFTSFRPLSRCYELAFENDSCLSDASRGFLRNGAQILLNGLTQEKGLIWLLWKHRNGSQIRQRRFGFRVSVSFRTRSQIAHLLHCTPTEFFSVQWKFSLKCSKFHDAINNSAKYHVQ